jgi:CubicO group peptidase (beta-lactamase class C family)
MIRIRYLQKRFTLHPRLRSPSLVLIVSMMVFMIFIMTACETPKSRMRQRMKSVENGLLKAAVFKGLEPEKMKLAERMQYYRVPGVSIATIYKNQIDWAKAYGVKNARFSDPILSDSLFQAAALSQPVAALTALHFVRKGRLSLDTDVNTVLKSWKVPESPLTQRNKVTLRRILNHSASFIPGKLNGCPHSKDLPSLKMILDGEKPALPPGVQLFGQPGAMFLYSDAGYAVLQQLLVDLEEKSFPEIAEEAVLQPLRMRNSTFECPLPSGLEEKAVSGHLREGAPVEGGWYRYPAAAASGLWSTPSDLALFVIEVMKTARGESQKIVSPALAQAMLTPEEGIHGLGLYIEDAGDNLFFHISGSSKGYDCILVGYPVRGEGAVVMTNSENGYYIIHEILRGISAAYEWPHFQPEVKTLYRLDASIYPQYVGKYEVNPDYILDVAHEDYYLIITPTGQVPTKFYAQGLTVFFSTDPYILIRFVKDSAGKVTGLILNQRGQSTEARKIE